MRQKREVAIELVHPPRSVGTCVLTSRRVRQEVRQERKRERTGPSAHRRLHHCSRTAKFQECVTVQKGFLWTMLDQIRRVLPLGFKVLERGEDGTFTSHRSTFRRVQIHLRVLSSVEDQSTERGEDISLNSSRNTFRAGEVATLTGIASSSPPCPPGPRTRTPE